MPLPSNCHIGLSKLIDQSEGSLTLSLVECIGNPRPITLKEHGIISGCTNNAANNRSENWNEEVAALGCENLTSIDNSRENSGSKISGRVQSLCLLAPLGQTIEGQQLHIHSLSASPGQLQS